ncbi:MAG: PilW family protein [Legionellales bacterium]|nr:PilW family protein [Legionellales bacterium]
MKTSYGFSLVEILVGLTLGVILSAAVIAIYISEKNTYKTSTSQASIQNAESAIAALVTPTIRGAGFSGCTTLLMALSNLNPGGPPPLGTLGTTPSMVNGYGSAAASPVTITENTANSAIVTNWTPSLDASLSGRVEAVSDVVVVLGAVPGTQPIGVTAATAGSNAITLQNTTGLTTGLFGSISDCSKTSVIAITGIAGTTVTHAASAGILNNTNDTLLVNFQTGSVFVPLSQTAFYVANDPGGQSTLTKATLNANGTWTSQSLVPGVEIMKVLYGIGSNNALTNYVSASAVTNWNQVYAIRLGFLLEGQPGSGDGRTTQFTVLGTTVKVPTDTRLRHVFEITIELRNSTS